MAVLSPVYGAASHGVASHGAASHGALSRGDSGSTQLTDVLDRAFELADLCGAQVARRLRSLNAVSIAKSPRRRATHKPAVSCSQQMRALAGPEGTSPIALTQRLAWGDSADMGTELPVHGEADDGDPAS